MLAHAVHNQYMTALIATEPYSMSAFYAAELGFYTAYNAPNVANECAPPARSRQEPADASTPTAKAGCREDAMMCERCGKAEMYLMHAVWRCPDCGFKTDCCGW